MALALTACADPTEPLPLDGNAVLENGALLVRGDDGANDIRITNSASGVDVMRDGETARFTTPVQAIEIRAGQGSDAVWYDQSVVSDLALSIVSGEGDDDVLVSVAPTGADAEMTLGLMIDTGPGGDRTEFRWDGAAVPALSSHVTLEATGRVHLPEQDDEVLVTFASGDPDRPVILGTVWNGQGSANAPGGDDRSLSLELDFRAGRADVALAISGGAGPDQVGVDADYSGVTLQQGRLSVDADLGEGDNSLGKYVVTSVTHTHVDTRVTAGDGDNVLDLQSVLGGDGDHTYVVELGDGDNETTIRFGDGIRGRRPTTGERSVTGTYTSGSGVNAVSLEADLVEPLVSDFAIDYGAGRGDTSGRYKLRFPWDRDAAPGTGTVPSQIKLVLLSPSGSDYDLRIDVGDPQEDGPEALGVVTATASAIQETDLEFLHRLAAPSGAAEVEEDWEIRVGGLTTSGDAGLIVDGPPGLDRLVYLQDALKMAAGATVTVRLEGSAAADAVLAHLIGIGGAGRFELLTSGDPGDDLLAVLTRDLDAAGGAEMAFHVLGGDGDDVVGLAVPPGLAPGSPIVHTVTGGSGTDACFTSQGVPVTQCARVEEIGEELLSLLESTFGQALAEVWRPGS